MNNLAESKIVVTGASGFIGSHLVGRLARMGAKVTALVHYNSSNNWNNLECLSDKIKNNIKVVSGDILDEEFLTSLFKNQQIVFHLAALISIPYSYTAPKIFAETNILGTINVFQACLRNKIKRIVHTSTSEVYGSAKYVPIDEKHPLQAQSPYSATKIAADKIAESYWRSFDLPVVIIRPFNTFGPRQSARAVIPTIITQALVSDTVKLGSLFPIRDLNYVSNTVEGFILCASQKNIEGNVFNIGYGEGITIKELVKKIIKLIGRPKIKVISDDKRIRPKKSEVSRLICDYKEAKKKLNYRPIHTLEEGLIKTIEWIKENIDRYKTDSYSI